MSRPAGTPLSLPAEVGGRRTITLRTLREGICRSCGAPVLRVANGQDDWIHTQRVSGIPVGHPARPRGVSTKPRFALNPAQNGPRNPVGRVGA